MNNDIKTWLYDILNAIMEIKNFFKIIQKNLVPTKLTLEQKELLNEI